MLVLDAGNTIYGQALAVQSKGQVIVESMSAMGYDAMTVGESDLRLGLDLLLQRAEEADFIFLSCNLVDPASSLSLILLFCWNGMALGSASWASPIPKRRPWQ